MKYFLLVMGVLSIISIAQTEYIDSKYSQLHEGKMFLVKATPAGKKIDLLVTGREVATLKATNIGLVAVLHSNGRQYNLRPVQDNNKFSLDLPVESESQLQLDIRYQDQNEKFNIPLNQTP